MSDHPDTLNEQESTLVISAVIYYLNELGKILDTAEQRGEQDSELFIDVDTFVRSTVTELLDEPDNTTTH